MSAIIKRNRDLYPVITEQVSDTVKYIYHNGQEEYLKTVILLNSLKEAQQLI
jgi:hypothetical protein